MKFLHSNMKEFTKTVDMVSRLMNIDAAFVEKDYYVFMTLKLIHEQVPNEVVFKGGTSLSKAYNLIARFSEDIDLCLIREKMKSGGARKRLVAAILNSFESLDLEYVPNGKLERHGVYNDMRSNYTTIVANNPLEQYIKVEVAHRVGEYPVCTRQISSYIGDCLLRFAPQLVPQYNLESFTITTVDFRRTFMDKLFALADYYLLGKVTRYSRHLYDIYKLSNNIDIASDRQALYSLYKEVNAERRGCRGCRSSDAGVVLSRVIKQVMDCDYYRDDYNNVTRTILLEPIAYEMCKQRVYEILQCGIID